MLVLQVIVPLGMLFYFWLRPSIEGNEFDAAMAGAALVPVVLSVRMLGFAIVTPLMEELFMRSFLIRYVDVLDVDLDVEKSPEHVLMYVRLCCESGIVRKLLA